MLGFVNGNHPGVTSGWVGSSGTEKGSLLSFDELLTSDGFGQKIKVESLWLSSLLDEEDERHFLKVIFINYKN